MNTLHSFRKIAPGRPHPTTFLFAYESAEYALKTLDAWYSSVDIPDRLENYPLAIYSLNRGVILLTLNGQKMWFHRPVYDEKGSGPRIRSLSLFLQAIRKSQLLYAGVEGNLFSHALFDGLKPSEFGYKFGAENADSNTA